MKEYEHIDLPEASHEAVHAARDAAQAIELSRQLQTEKAAEAAVSKVTNRMGDIMQERMEHVLAKGTEQDKAMILARVPFICQDIKSISFALREISQKMDQVKEDLDAKDIRNEKKFVTQDQFSPFKWGVTLVASVVITTIVGALLALVILKP